MKIGPDDVALITGAGGGIGRAIAQALLACGVKLALADIDPVRAEATRAALGGPPDRVRTVVLDVTDAESWRQAMEVATETFGPVSILVNNAGIGNVCPLAEEDAARWRMVLEVDAFGPFLGCRSALPDMLSRGRGHVVNIASTAGLMGVPGMSSYVAAKHAVVGLTETLRLELAGTGVGVTLVAPGAVATDFFANSAAAITAGVKAGAPPLGPDPLAAGITPDLVGRRIALAIEQDEAIVLTHADWKPVLRTFYADRLAAIGAPANGEFTDPAAAVGRSHHNP